MKRHRMVFAQLDASWTILQCTLYVIWELLRHAPLPHPNYASSYSSSKAFCPSHPLFTYREHSGTNTELSHRIPHKTAALCSFGPQSRMDWSTDNTTICKEAPMLIQS